MFRKIFICLCISISGVMFFSIISANPKYNSMTDSELFKKDRKAYSERIKKFDREHKKKINSLSIKGLANRKTDTWWRRLIGKSTRNYKTFDYDPKAPFYEPRSSVKCASLSNMDKDLSREFLNTYLMERNLKERFQGDDDALEEIDQMTCGDLYQTYFRR